MAGGVAAKGSALVGVALAKLTTALQQLQWAQENGLVTSGADPTLAANVDPAVAAAVTALQAVQ